MGLEESRTASTLPDRQITHHDVIAEGDEVLFRWSMTGTQKGGLMGIPASCKQIKVTASGYFRVAAGKIQEMWQEVDQLDMMQQPGVIRAPGQ